ncbi:MAG: DUF4231 domain-containing protein [Desulfobacterales bacterium]|nr:DUF4231 domain-containing protein [Desulfobacterales bacterium]
MNQDEYLKDRLCNQIKWYDDKSVVLQRRFKILSSLEIIFAAFIPFLSALSDETGILKIIIAGLGTAVVIFAGISSMNKYQELWISYRTTAETLKHHKFLFETQCAPYNDKDAFSRLVENVEAIISREHSNWSSMLKEQQKRDKINEKGVK